MDSVKTVETELTEILCPYCPGSFADLPKHLIEHRYKMCNACDIDISEKRTFKWKKGGGALKAHWTSRHKADFTYCVLENCSFHLSPIGTTHVCE